LHEKYNDDIPDNIEELIKLPGVGKKMVLWSLKKIKKKIFLVTNIKYLIELIVKYILIIYNYKLIMIIIKQMNE